MSDVVKWSARIGAAMTAATLAVFVPAAAWAAQAGVLDVAYEAVRRPRSRGVGLIGLLCCLVVVGAIVLGVLLILRSRRRK